MKEFVIYRKENLIWWLNIKLVGGIQNPLEAEDWKDVERIIWGIKLSSKTLFADLICVSQTRQNWCLVLDLSISPSYGIRNTLSDPGMLRQSRFICFSVACHVCAKILKTKHVMLAISKSFEWSVCIKGWKTENQSINKSSFAWVLARWRFYKKALSFHT